MAKERKGNDLSRTMILLAMLSSTAQGQSILDANILDELYAPGTVFPGVLTPTYNLNVHGTPQLSIPLPSWAEADFTAQYGHPVTLTVSEYSSGQTAQGTIVTGLNVSIDYVTPQPGDSPPYEFPFNVFTVAGIQPSTGNPPWQDGTGQSNIPGLPDGFVIASTSLDYHWFASTSGTVMFVPEPSSMVPAGLVASVKLRTIDGG